MAENLIGNDIRLRRKATRCSLRAFAGEIGMNPAYLSQIERGVQRPGREAIYKIYSKLTEKYCAYDNQDKFESNYNKIILNNPDILLLIQKLADTEWSIYIPILVMSSLRISKFIDETKNSSLNSNLKDEDITTFFPTIIKGFFKDLKELRINKDYKPKPVDETIKELLLNITKETFISTEEIAAKAGITHDHLCQILYGYQVPSDNVEKRLLNVLERLGGYQYTEEKDKTEKIYGIPKTYLRHPYMDFILHNMDTYNKWISTAIQFPIEALNKTKLINWEVMGDIKCLQEIIDYYLITILKEK